MNLKTYLFCLNEDVDIQEFENLAEEEEVVDEGPTELLLQKFSNLGPETRYLQKLHKWSWDRDFSVAKRKYTGAKLG